ncbi:MAG: pyridoxal phosphate-dependent aminotransferase [Polyangiales bacterium]
MSAQAIRASVFSDLAPRLTARLARGETPHPLHIGDTWRAPPPAASLARHASDDPALYRYGPLGGAPSLLAAIARHLDATGRALDGATPANLLVAAGATHALHCAARAIFDARDECLVLAPYWPLSVGVLRTAGATPVEVPVMPMLARDPRFDLARALDAAVTPRTRAVYFITPNNPDGFVMGEDHLAAVADVARRRDLWVIADEVYADYVYEGAHRSVARLPGMGARTVSAYSLSKSHALAGLRVGYVAGPPDLIAAAKKVATHTVFNVPVVAQRAAEAALTDGNDFIAGARDAYRAARDATVRALEGRVDFVAPAGGSYVFADLGRGGGALEVLGRAIDAGVALAPGDAFGEAYGSWARLCFTAVPPDALDDALARLTAVLDG